MKKYNVIVIFNKEMTKTLMCKRTKEPYIGMYNLVGGKIEKENDFLNEAYRELKEETNIDKNDVKLKHFMNIEYLSFNKSLEVYYGILNKEVKLIEEINKLVIKMTVLEYLKIVNNVPAHEELTAADLYGIGGGFIDVVPEDIDFENASGMSSPQYLVGRDRVLVRRIVGFRENGEKVDKKVERETLFNDDIALHCRKGTTPVSVLEETIEGLTEMLKSKDQEINKLTSEKDKALGALAKTQIMANRMYDIVADIKKSPVGKVFFGRKLQDIPEKNKFLDSGREIDQ